MNPIVQSNSALQRRRSAQSGVTLIELLVSLVVLSIGLFGVMQLYAAGQQSELESQQRAEALVIINDMVDRINSNRSAADCYTFSDNTEGTNYAGTGGSISDCSGVGTSATRKVADEDIDEWGEQLREGGLVGGRGCIYTDGPRTYEVVVVWQGRSQREDPDALCADGQYGDVTDGQSRRRAITRTIRMARL